MESTELKDVVSSPPSPVVDSPSDETVEPKPTNNNGEELEPKTPALKDVSRRRSSLKTPANNDKDTSKTPIVKSSKAKATKSAETTTSTAKKAVGTPMKDDKAEIPNGTTTKKRGRPSKSSLATPVDADVQTPKDSKPVEGKKKKITATPATEHGNDVESPDVDSSIPAPTAVKKKKSLILNKKTDLQAQGENDDDLAAVTPNASVAGDPKARGRKKSVGIAGTEEPLFTDDRLPEGWSRILIQRQGGATAGKYDVYIMSPENKRFRSRNELRNFITKKSLDLQADDFDFSVCGKDLKTAVTDSPIQTAPAKKAVKRKSVAPKAVTKVTPPPKKAKMKQTKLDSLHIISDRPDDPSPSPYFSDHSESKRPHSVLRIKPLISPKKWSPPRSPYNLIQENLFHNPWQLLVATILLNKSLVLENDLAGKSATPVIYALFDKWATPEAAESADIREMSKLIRPLGLHEKRAYSIKRFSAEYRSREWCYPNELYGIGKYGNDSYRMFCVNEWRAVNPSDTMLIMYKNWMVNNWRELCNNTNNCLGIAAK